MPLTDGRAPLNTPPALFFRLPARLRLTNRLAAKESIAPNSLTRARLSHRDLCSLRMPLLPFFGIRMVPSAGIA